MIERTTNKTRTDWRTPKSIIDIVKGIYQGTIDMDPCASIDPHHRFAAKNLSIHSNGLKHRWTGNVFINPPYGRGKEGIASWISKGKAEYNLGNTRSQIWLVPARLDTRWWRELMTYADCFAIPKGRITFEGANAGAQFPSALVYVGNDRANFYWRLLEDAWSFYKAL